MKISEFQLERNQSLYENQVQYNLTESDVHPYHIKQLLTEEEIEQFLGLPIGYPQTNGTALLRHNIALMYPSATKENILVTNGSSEANFLLIWSLLNPGDEMLFMIPNFMQIHGLARSFGIKVHTYELQQELGWEPDFTAIQNLITPKTKLISICNPNNPTGHILSQAAMQKFVEIAKEHDLWIHADEIYRGAEIDSDQETPSFYGTYSKVLISSGLSKAYALQGLRLGWLVGPADFIYNAWTYSDYTTISASKLSMHLGEIVLHPEKRPEVLSRNRSVLKQNLSILDAWISKHHGTFELIHPMAGGMAFVRYHFPLNSTEFSHQLREQKSVFIVAGDWFGMDQYIRIGIGSQPDYLKAGLELIDEFLEENGYI